MHSFRKTLVDDVWKYEVIYVGTAFDAQPVRRIGLFDAADDACAWVSYLNGGGKPTGPFPIGPFPT
jgi:hypothetical protein